jgi:hypothetical protein
MPTRAFKREEVTIMTATIADARTRNITRTFWAATQEDRTEARAWYERARGLAVTIAAEYHAVEYFEDGEVCYTPEGFTEAAAVIAVLSPRLAWRKNVQVAWQAYDLVYGNRVTEDEFVSNLPVLNANARKVWRLIHDREDPYDVVSGPKVTAFWHTIRDPYDPRTVVIDRHALDVAIGRVLDDKARGAILGRKGAYATLSDLYRRAAKSISKQTVYTWTPAQVQAVTWTYWRRERAAAYHGEV